jgi:hypothetical protein
MRMFHPAVLRLLPVTLAALLALGTAADALASGGNYAVDGGTPRERGQVRAALDASAFDWNLVPKTIQIHVRRGTQTRSAPGEIWVDAGLLDAGRYSWGFVQHEYAHQVDFFDFSDTTRLRLDQLLHGKSWWGRPGMAHSDRGCERFASTLAWAYWPSKDNALKPSGPVGSEAGAMRPSRFRSLLQQLLGGPRTADARR